MEDFSTTTQKNPRAEITHKKYQKQIDWRRNKVRELLISGYPQYEKSDTLHKVNLPFLGIFFLLEILITVLQNKRAFSPLLL